MPLPPGQIPDPSNNPVPSPASNGSLTPFAGSTNYSYIFGHLTSEQYERFLDGLPPLPLPDPKPQGFTPWPSFPSGQTALLLEAPIGSPILNGFSTGSSAQGFWNGHPIILLGGGMGTQPTVIIHGGPSFQINNILLSTYDSLNAAFQLQLGQGELRFISREGGPIGFRNALSNLLVSAQNSSIPSIPDFGLPIPPNSIPGGGSSPTPLPGNSSNIIERIFGTPSINRPVTFSITGSQSFRIPTSMTIFGEIELDSTLYHGENVVINGVVIGQNILSSLTNADLLTLLSYLDLIQRQQLYLRVGLNFKDLRVTQFENTLTNPNLIIEGAVPPLAPIGSWSPTQAQHWNNFLTHYGFNPEAELRTYDSVNLLNAINESLSNGKLLLNEIPINVQFHLGIATNNSNYSEGFPLSTTRIGGPIPNGVSFPLIIENRYGNPPIVAEHFRPNIIGLIPGGNVPGLNELNFSPHIPDVFNQLPPDLPTPQLPGMLPSPSIRNRIRQILRSPLQPGAIGRLRDTIIPDPQTIFWEQVTPIHRLGPGRPMVLGASGTQYILITRGDGTQVRVPVANIRQSPPRVIRPIVVPPLPQAPIPQNFPIAIIPNQPGALDCVKPHIEANPAVVQPPPGFNFEANRLRIQQHNITRMIDRFRQQTVNEALRLNRLYATNVAITRAMNAAALIYLGNQLIDQFLVAPSETPDEQFNRFVQNLGRLTEGNNLPVNLSTLPRNLQRALYNATGGDADAVRTFMLNLKNSINSTTRFGITRQGTFTADTNQILSNLNISALDFDQLLSYTGASIPYTGADYNAARQVFVNRGEENRSRLQTMGRFQTYTDTAAENPAQFLQAINNDLALVSVLSNPSQRENVLEIARQLPPEYGAAFLNIFNVQPEIPVGANPLGMLQNPLTRNLASINMPFLTAMEDTIDQSPEGRFALDDNSNLIDRREVLHRAIGFESDPRGRTGVNRLDPGDIISELANRDRAIDTGIINLPIRANPNEIFSNTPIRANPNPPVTAGGLAPIIGNIFDQVPPSPRIESQFQSRLYQPELNEPLRDDQIIEDIRDRQRENLGIILRTPERLAIAENDMIVADSFRPLDDIEDSSTNDMIVADSFLERLPSDFFVPMPVYRDPRNGSEEKPLLPIPDRELGLVLRDNSISSDRTGEISTGLDIVHAGGLAPSINLVNPTSNDGAFLKSFNSPSSTDGAFLKSFNSPKSDGAFLKSFDQIDLGLVKGGGSLGLVMVPSAGNDSAFLKGGDPRFNVQAISDEDVHDSRFDAIGISLGPESDKKPKGPKGHACKCCKHKTKMGIKENLRDIGLDNIPIDPCVCPIPIAISPDSEPGTDCESAAQIAIGSEQGPFTAFGAIEHWFKVTAGVGSNKVNMNVTGLTGQAGLTTYQGNCGTLSQVFAGTIGLGESCAAGTYDAGDVWIRVSPSGAQSSLEYTFTFSPGTCS